MGLHHDRGVVAEGRRADLVLLAGDPNDASGLRERVRTVIQAGRVVAENA